MKCETPPKRDAPRAVYLRVALSTVPRCANSAPCFFFVDPRSSLDRPKRSEDVIQDVTHDVESNNMIPQYACCFVKGCNTNSIMHLMGLLSTPCTTTPMYSTSTFSAVPYTDLLCLALACRNARASHTLYRLAYLHCAPCALLDYRIASPSSYLRCLRAGGSGQRVGNLSIPGRPPSFP